MFCQKCGVELAEDAVFCPKCGQKQVEESQPTPEGPKEEKITTQDAVSGGLGIIQIIVAIALVVVGFSALLSTCS